MRRLLWVIFVALFCITTFLVVSLIISYQNKSLLSQATPTQLTTPSPTPSKPKTTYTLLLIGYGGAGHEGGTLSDSLILIQSDIVTKKVHIISIPRDTWVQIPEGNTINNKKINNAFSIGGGELAKQIVAQVTGILADNYVAIDFGGFSRAVDTLGGVDVKVPASFDDYFYPIKGLENETCGKSADDIAKVTATMSGYLLEQQFSCRYEHLHFEKGVVHMDGATALKFVRSRHAEINGGDFARSQRQQVILQAMKEKAFSLGALNQATSFFHQFIGMIQTDINEAIIDPTLSFLGDPKGYTVTALNLSTDNILMNTTSSDRQYILVPKDGSNTWDSVKGFLTQELQK
jgi:LCP family protein required for cell wall assembly